MSEILKASVVGAGLAGCEAALALARAGIEVTLYDIKPHEKTPAHHSNNLAELVCSNSLKAARITSAAGLLKEEMKRLGSVMMEAAAVSSVPAGGALAVDREIFSSYITKKIEETPNIHFVSEHIKEIPEGPCIIATGPLTTDDLAKSIAALTGQDALYFFDAAAPIVEYSSIDMTKAYRKSRYDKGDGDDYINCPMDAAQYNAFVDALLEAETAPVHGFEENMLFEGCMPIESMARRGRQTIAFGPLKPIGLQDPRTGKTPYAVVQLRQDDAEGSIYNLVGFQTRLKFGEQKRVFSMIPGLENASFVRYGVMHRNTYINAPGFLEYDFSTKQNPLLYFAGQLSGVEGYVESAASGLYAALSLAAKLLGKAPVRFSANTMIGALGSYISAPHTNFAPMNANFGIIASMPQRYKNKQLKYEAYAQRALEEIDAAVLQL